MRLAKLFYLPFAFFFFLILLFMLFLLPVIMGGAFHLLGFDPVTTVFLFFLSLVGSVINLPVYTVKTKEVVPVTSFSSFYGFIYPHARRRERVRETTVALNLGGALIPILISVYLILTHPALWGQYLIGAILICFLSYKLARPIPGVGITMPALVPPIASALIALLIPGGPATAIAYVSGVIGVLVGADLFNLNQTAKAGTKVLSIGGAGTFDGIFLTGIISVILVA
ncbi:MAG: DUF1614 domain-containing protein [Thermoproteota archaeon]